MRFIPFPGFLHNLFLQHCCTTDAKDMSGDIELSHAQPSVVERGLVVWLSTSSDENFA